MANALISAIEAVLRREAPGYLSADVIASQLALDGIRVSPAEVERAIEQDMARFEAAAGNAPMWRLRDRQAVAVGSTPRLYAWQNEAIAAWVEEGGRGIVEAVTGTGKTMVGIEAIRRAFVDGGRAHVIVPTIELQNQWVAVIRERLPRVRIGRRGNSSQADFARKDVIVSVVNSARRFDPGRLPEGSLLVADEVHRYGSPENSKALHAAFSRRLGLTATLEREDDGVDDHIAPYFGSVVFEIGYRRAIDDGVVAPFRLALIGVDFASPGEKAAYEKFERETSDARKELILRHGVPPEPFGEFMRAVALMADGKAAPDGSYPTNDGTGAARRFLKAFTGKRELLANTASKLDALERLAPIVRKAGGTIVFTETIAGAEAAAERLQEADVNATAIHSEHGSDERRDALDDFRDGTVTAICAPRILDEGIDVPDADLGIILAASRQRRQMIQRMGRVLRRKADAREARFAVVYVRGTAEDPESGAHEAFLDEITSVAQGDKSFGPMATTASLERFLG